MLDVETWREPARAMCPEVRDEPSECDCGYIGYWLIRWWTRLEPCKTSGSVKTGKVIQKCLACRNGGEGHPIIAGWEESCPRCGDEERFDWAGNLVSRVRPPPGENVVWMNPDAPRTKEEL